MSTVSIGTTAAAPPSPCLGKEQLYLRGEISAAAKYLGLPDGVIGADLPTEADAMREIANIVVVMADERVNSHIKDAGELADKPISSFPADCPLRLDLAYFQDLLRSAADSLGWNYLAMKQEFQSLHHARTFVRFIKSVAVTHLEKPDTDLSVAWESAFTAYLSTTVLPTSAEEFITALDLFAKELNTHVATCSTNEHAKQPAHSTDPVETLKQTYLASKLLALRKYLGGSAEFADVSPLLSVSHLKDVISVMEPVVTASIRVTTTENADAPLESLPFSSQVAREVAYHREIIGGACRALNLREEDIDSFRSLHHARALARFVESMAMMRIMSPDSSIAGAWGSSAAACSAVFKAHALAMANTSYSTADAKSTTVPAPCAPIYTEEPLSSPEPSAPEPTKPRVDSAPATECKTPTYGVGNGERTDPEFFIPNLSPDIDYASHLAAFQRFMKAEHLLFFGGEGCSNLRQTHFREPVVIDLCGSDYVRADLGDDWARDRAGAEGALLNAIACDDGHTMLRVCSSGLIDLSAAIDVRRVRATTAPNYVRTYTEYKTNADGLVKVERVLFGRKHALTYPLQATPLVIAAVSHASNCARVLAALGAPIGGTGAVVEHLLEAVLTVPDSGKTLYRVDAPIGSDGTIGHQPIARFDYNLQHTLKGLFKTLCRSRAIPYGASNPISVLRETYERDVLHGKFVDGLDEIFTDVLSILENHGYSPDEPVGKAPRATALARFGRYSRSAFGDKGDEESTPAASLAAARALLSHSTELEEARRQHANYTGGRETDMYVTKATHYHSRHVDGMGYLLGSIVSLYEIPRLEEEPKDTASA